MVAVMPLAVAWVDLLPVGADEGLLPADPAVCEAALDVHGGGGRGLVCRVEPVAGLVEGIVTVAALVVLEGGAALVEDVVRAWAVRGAVGGGWMIGVCSWVSGIGGVLGRW